MHIFYNIININININTINYHNHTQILNKHVGISYAL